MFFFFHFLDGLIIRFCSNLPKLDKRCAATKLHKGCEVATCSPRGSRIYTARGVMVPRFALIQPRNNVQARNVMRPSQKLRTDYNNKRRWSPSKRSEHTQKTHTHKRNVMSNISLRGRSIPGQTKPDSKGWETLPM